MLVAMMIRRPWEGRRHPLLVPGAPADRRAGSPPHPPNSVLPGDRRSPGCPAPGHEHGDVATRRVAEDLLDGLNRRLDMGSLPCSSDAESSGAYHVHRYIRPDLNNRRVVEMTGEGTRVDEWSRW